MRELATRTAVGILLIAIALVEALLGGWPFAILVAAMATIMYVEWSRIVARWGFGWKLFGFVYCLLPAISLLWIRERAEYQDIGKSFDLLIWVFLVVWATDIGAYFAGRAIDLRGPPARANRLRRSGFRNRTARDRRDATASRSASCGRDGRFGPGPPAPSSRDRKSVV